ncbi:hypothetical protein C2U72_26865 [Prosthecomicrobium hirschii]|uniref:hypothetical protein n=1 Tax=Prosthecodimorpha hirschii TaxID=665126 RepID=UPI0011263C52|nr:hypothetical protein [Prosthecomicrobium hirschii]TPQ45342.1 hypothetical protein C2U72_26865 [Prosthecomicrobium hirschii]
MLEKRVERLENDLREVRTTVSRLETLLIEIRANFANVASRDDASKSREDMARIQGRLENMPSVWQMITVVLGSQIALAGLLFTAIKFGIK